jgi:hypothetical protein
MKRILLVLALAATGLGVPALSAHAVGPVEIGLGGGVSLPVSDFKDSFNNGFNVMGVVNVKPPMFPVGLRGSVGYQRFGAAETGGVTDGSTKMTSVLGGFVYQVIPVGPVSPYFTLSGGAFHLDTQITAGGEKSQQKTTAFGLDAGLGVKVNLVSVKLFAEARFQNLFAKKALDPALDKHDLRATPLTVGMLF